MCKPALFVAALLLLGSASAEFAYSGGYDATFTNCTSSADGTVCDDGNACTVGETCRAGECLPPVSFAQAAGSPVAVGTSPRSVAVGDVNGDGELDLVVANYGANNVSVLLGNGSGGFSPAAGSPVAVGTLPVSLAVGDVNGDGKLDLAVASFFSNDVTILLGNGSGGFSPAAGSPVAAGTSPRSVVFGDVNADGKLDLAVPNLGSNNVTILLGNGAGGFSPAAGSPVVVGTQPASIVIGDVNGDGQIDLAVANYGSDSVTILLGNGSGGFSPAAGSPVAAGTGPASVAIGDVNGDVKLDLAVANYGSDNVTILLGNGSGGFSPAAGSPVAVGTAPLSVAIADVNGDVRLDLGVASYGSNNVTLLLGNGSGGFSPAAGSPVAVGTNPEAVTVGDVNADGRRDLAVANSGSANITILLNDTSFASDGTTCDDGNACTVGETCRSGNCLAPVSLTQPAGSPIAVGNPYSVTMCEVNGDGRLDLAVASNNTGTVTILLGNGSGGFSQAAGSPVAVGLGPFSVAAADWNGDGRLDLAVANSNSDNVTILLGNGSGGFSEAALSPVAVGTYPVFVAIGDANGDGKLDLAAANWGSSNVTILLGNGSGGFSPAAGSPVAVGGNPISVAVGDVNRDGKLDLAVVNATSDNVTILLGSGSGAFSQAAGSPVAVGTFPHSVAVGDVSGDGKLDLAVANSSSNDVTVLLGNGSGGFSQAAGSPIAVGAVPDSIVIGDVSGDGRVDLAVASYSSGDVTILVGNGSGAFQAAGSPFASGSQSISIAIGDLNADGKLDLAAANATGSVTILLGKTCPTGGCFVLSLEPSSGSPVGAGTDPFSVAVGDVNGDGKSDLAVSNFTSGDVNVLLGNGSGGFNQAAGSPIALGALPAYVAFGDVNGDGKLDLAVARFNNSSVTVLLGNGSGGFSPAAGSPFGVGLGPVSLAFGDMNADGKLDLAVGNSNTNDVTILLGNGSGGFSQATGSPVSAGSFPGSVSLGDLTGDGKLDLAVVNQSSGDVTILIGDGSGGFSQASGSPIATGSLPYSGAFGDVNGDGKLDLAVANGNSNNVTILIGNGAGGFSQAAGSPVAVGTNPYFVALADLSGDGRLDLAVANGASNDVTILIGNGAGGFAAAGGSPVAVGMLPYSIAVAELNGDGRLDLAVVNRQSNDVTILLNDTIAAPDATACNDGVACTTSDTCTSGLCSGTPVAPAEVDNGVRVGRSGGAAVITWNLAAGATSSAVLRGLESALPVGPGGGDEICLAGNLASNTLTWSDGIDPAIGASFWYLVRGDNVCGKGPYGFHGQNGSPTVPRLTTTCP